MRDVARTSSPSLTPGRTTRQQDTQAGQIRVESVQLVRAPASGGRQRQEKLKPIPARSLRLRFRWPGEWSASWSQLAIPSGEEHQFW